jgi:hypothetical protein
MARLQQHFREKIAPELKAKFGYKSLMEVPRVTKITLNMGLSEAVSDKKIIEHAVGDMTKIAGQKPVVTKARKAIAGQAWTIENFQRQTGDLVAKCAEQSAKLENAADTIQRQAKRWAEISAERDAAIELAREMRDSLIGPGATPQCVKLVREFDERYGQPDSPPCDPPPTCEPLPPVADEPTIEFVRYRYDPAVVYRPKTIDRNTAGRVVKVDCGAVVLTGEFEGLVDGQWRSI